MKHESGLTPRPRRLPNAEDFAQAKASRAVGGGTEDVAVGASLLTWGKPGRKDFDAWLNDQDG